MKKTQPVDIDALINDGEAVKAAVRRGGIEAMKQHIRAGEPMVSWRDGKVVMLTPEELTAMLERYTLEDAQT